MLVNVLCIFVVALPCEESNNLIRFDPAPPRNEPSYSV